MDKVAEQEETRRKVAAEQSRAVLERYYIEKGQENPLGTVRHLLESLHSPVNRIGAAFEHNVSAVELTMGIPAALAGAAARMKAWTQVVAAERIRSRGDKDRGSPESEARIYERAREHMSRHIAEIGDEIFVDDMCDFLLEIHQLGQIPRALFGASCTRHRPLMVGGRGTCKRLVYFVFEYEGGSHKQAFGR